MKAKVRDSNLELMRLFAIFSVLMYHAISYYTINFSPDNKYGYVFWLPFRTAVALFVMISGYYHIRFSIRGLSKLVCKTLVLFVPIELTVCLLSGGGKFELLQCLFPISRGPYWYILQYLCLFMMAPVINTYLERVTAHQRLYLLGVLSFMSIYFGLIGAEGMEDGKNIIHFLLLYVMGDTLFKYKHRLDNIKTVYFIFAFLLINIGMVLYFSLTFTSPYPATWSLFDKNNGPFLLINAVVTFILFSRLKIKSRPINFFASSVLAIYIIQQEPFIANMITNVYHKIWNPDFVINCSGIALTFKLVLFCIGRSFLFIIVSVIIDKILTSIWRLLDKLTIALWNPLSNRLNRIGALHDLY